MLLPRQGASELQREGCHIANSIHIRVAALQVAVHLDAAGRALQQRERKEGLI